VAARRPHPADVPGVDDGHLGFRMEVGDAHVLIAVGPPPGHVTVEDLAGAVEQERMHAAAGEEPVPGDAVAARHGDGPAARVRRACRDVDRIATAARAADLRPDWSALAEAVDAHGQAPAR